MRARCVLRQLRVCLKDIGDGFMLSRVIPTESVVSDDPVDRHFEKTAAHGSDRRARNCTAMSLIV